jgi:hypothetical protein
MSKHRSTQKTPPLAGEITVSTEEELDKMEADPRFQEFMDKVDKAEREGRIISHDEVIERMHAARSGRP